MVKMFVLSDLCELYDDLERVVNRHTFNSLYERYNGYNLIDDNEKKQFDFEFADCIFTIKKAPHLDYCALNNNFQIFINGEWVDFERW